LRFLHLNLAHRQPIVMHDLSLNLASIARRGV
jgi:hypothetical protein